MPQTFIKPEGRIPLGRPSRRQQDAGRVDLTETGWNGLDWIHVAGDKDECQRTPVNMLMN
jgi:hypothetical protein